jgi:hypothetical protein
MMKLAIVSLIMVSTIWLSSCKSNSTSPNTTTISSGMTATINGKAWKSDAVVGFRHAATATPNLQFEGWVNQPFVQIPFNASPAITGPGTYPIITHVTSLTENSVEAVYNTTDASYSDSSRGSMTITTLTDKNVQGTFNFIAIDDFHGDTITITNGQFNIPLQ